LIEDDSINFHTFETNPELASKHMIVCSEYVARKNLTFGRNTTLMPLMPLLPHILSLIFCQKVEYFANVFRERYNGIKFSNYETTLLFDYTFTSEDAKLINKIRYDISQNLGNSDHISDASHVSTIKDDIFLLLTKQRIPINRDLPDWKTIVKWDSVKIPYENQIETPVSIKLLEIHENSTLFYSETQEKEIKEEKLNTSIN
jgi:hypothetical protein